MLVKQKCIHCIPPPPDLSLRDSNSCIAVTLALDSEAAVRPAAAAEQARCREMFSSTLPSLSLPAPACTRRPAPHMAESSRVPVAEDDFRFSCCIQCLAGLQLDIGARQTCRANPPSWLGSCPHLAPPRTSLLLLCCHTSKLQTGLQAQRTLTSPRLK